MQYITDLFKTYKNVFLGVLIVVFVCIILFSFRFVYLKGYHSGFDTAQEEIDKAYQISLEKKLEEQRNTLQNNFDVLLQREKDSKKIEVVYKDRIVKVKDIIKADNMKCEMNDEQIIQLNSLTRNSLK